MSEQTTYFCTSCAVKISFGEVCEKCEEKYGTPDDAPERFCNTCGVDLTETGGICDFCLDIEDES
jgi:predicted amidophosphoribosyltransferase